MGAICSSPRRIYASEERFLDLVSSHDTRLCVLDRVQDKQHAVELAAKSFCGTDATEPEGLFDWLLGSKFRGQYENEARLSVLRYSMEFAFEMCAMYGVNFGLRDPDTKKLIAVAMTRPPGSIKNGYADTYCTMMRAMWQLRRLPPWEKDGVYGKFFSKRLFLMDKYLHEMHQKYAAGDHWFVNVIAVSPEAQGKRCCSALMRHIIALADIDKRPCYLEAVGARNEAVYTKFGYTEVFKHDVEGIEKLFGEDEEVQPLQLIAMRRCARMT